MMNKQLFLIGTLLVCQAMGLADYQFKEDSTSQCAAQDKIRRLGPNSGCPGDVLTAPCLPGEVETVNPYIIDFASENLDQDMMALLFQNGYGPHNTETSLGDTMEDLVSAGGILSAFNSNGVLIRAAFRDRVCQPCTIKKYSAYEIPVDAGTSNTYILTSSGNGIKKWLLNYYDEDGNHNDERPTQCVDCAPGYQTNNLGEPGATTCTICDAGKFSPSSDIGCADCAQGSVTDKLELGGATTCTECDAGTYTSGPTVQCTNCTAGKFSLTPTTECADCADGSVTNKLEESGASTCTHCDAGKYSPNSQVGCGVCAPGSVTDKLELDGATTCTKCHAGEYSADSTTECEDCVIGTFADNDGTVVCTDLDTIASGTFVTNVDAAYKNGAAVNYEFDNIVVCDSGDYAANEISRFASRVDSNNNEILIPATQRTCRDCFESLQVQEGALQADGVFEWDKIQHESGLQLSQKLLCDDGTARKDICGNEIDALICKSSSTTIENEDKVDSSDIQKCSPGWYLNIVTNGLDTCEPCVEQMNSFDGHLIEWDPRFPVVCEDDTPVDPIAGYCQLTDNDGETEGLIVDFSFDDVAATKLKCTPWNKCNAVDEEIDVNPDPSGRWDRTCRCKTANIVGALESDCKSDTNGIMTTELHPTACKDGFRLREDSTNPENNKCVFDFNHQHSSNAAGVCQFSRLSDLFQYNYKLSDGNQILATAASDITPITYESISSQEVFPHFRGAEKKLLELDLTLHLNFLEDNNGDMRTDSGYTFFEYKFGQGSNQPFTSPSGTWVKITAPTLASHKTCFTKPSYILKNPQALTPETGSEGPWVVQDLSTDASCDTHTSVPLLSDLDEQYTTIDEWKDRQSSAFFSTDPYALSVDYIPIVHKLIGVASNCKNAEPTPKDIFAWSDLWGTAEDDIKITATIVIGNVDAEPGAGFNGNLNVQTNVFQTPGATNNALAQDLLFVSGAFNSGSIATATGTSSTQKEVSFSMAGTGSGMQKHGDIALTGKMDVTCSATMTVSGDEEDFRCYENSLATSQGESVGTEDHHAIPAVKTHATCQVKLDSKCAFTVAQDMNVEDKRVCYNVATQQECNDEFAATTDIVKDFGYTVNQNCVIVEAVRLHSSRKYPKETSTLPVASDFADIEEQDGGSSVSDTYFNCDDEKCLKDPYLVIKRKMTQSSISGSWEESGMTKIDNTYNTFVPNTYTPTTGCADTFVPGRTTRDCGTATNHPGQIKLNDNVIDNADGAQDVTSNIENHPIILPGAEYPNIYVFSLCTYTKTATEISDYDATTTINMGPGRRLGAPVHSYSAHGESYTILVPGVTDASH